MPRDQLELRVRKARSIGSARIQALAASGASGGILTSREVKEVCLAVVAEARSCGPDGIDADC